MVQFMGIDDPKEIQSLSLGWASFTKVNRWGIIMKNDLLPKKRWAKSGPSINC
jgi:hypothetical protein